MGETNLVLELWNWLNFKNEQIELTEFLQAGRNPRNLKVDLNFLDVHVQKWMWPVWSRDSKIDYLKNEQME